MVTSVWPLYISVRNDNIYKYLQINNWLLWYTEPYTCLHHREKIFFLSELYALIKRIFFFFNATSRDLAVGEVTIITPGEFYTFSLFYLLSDIFRSCLNIKRTQMMIQVSSGKEPVAWPGIIIITPRVWASTLIQDLSPLSHSSASNINLYFYAAASCRDCSLCPAVTAVGGGVCVMMCIIIVILIIKVIITVSWWYW